MVENKIIGLGLAYVDGKINSTTLHLPMESEKLPKFLDTHPEVSLYPGGSISNVLTAFVRLTRNPNINLLSCIGNDSRGKFYTNHLDEQLVGEIQVSSTHPTGLWVGIYHEGVVVERMDFIGASADVTVPLRELQRTGIGMFVTDVDACSIPQTYGQIEKAIDLLDDNGYFVLSLGGANKGRFKQSLLESSRAPNVVFGTASELQSLNSQSDLKDCMEKAFPASRLLVITQGEKGAVIRFDNQVVAVPAKYIPLKRVVDETGAGDCYMGTMLALLLEAKDTNWNIDFVKYAAIVGSYASSLVIQDTRSRLTRAMAQYVRNFVKGTL